MMASEQDALNEVMQILEAEPASLAPGNDIPAKREKLAVLVFNWQGQRGRRRSAHTRTSQTPVG